MAINMVDQCGDDVFRFCQCVALSCLRFDSILGELHFMPRIELNGLFCDRIPEDRTSERLDVLQRVFVLSSH